jgi:hypothetical protein
VGEGTDTGRAQVLAARAALDEELVRLEASARAAVDIPAKVKRNPVRAAGIAAGAGFLIVGGPRRIFRGARRAIWGPPEPLPKSMLPREIDEALRKLGGDGERVRGTIEREFAAYLEETAPRRNQRDLRTVMALMVLPIVRPLALRIGRQLVEQVFAPGTTGFDEQMARIRERTAAMMDDAADRAGGEGASPGRG